MTTVEFTDIGGVLRLKADGHANWGGRGHDLVCAAESILAYTLVTVSYTHLDVYKRQERYRVCILC